MRGRLAYAETVAKGEEEWSARSVIDRKILIIAMEEGYLGELLPESFTITKSGRRQDFPAFDLPTARAALRRVLEYGLVGTYVLNSDDVFLGPSAIASIESDTVWIAPASDRLCLFLTAAGERAVGIGDVRM